MKLLLLAMSIAGLVGCTTVGSIQADCQKSTSTFGAMAQCIEIGISQQPRLAANPSVELYRLKARQLAQRVDTGQLSDLDARVELQQLFVSLKRQEDDEPMPAVPQQKATRSVCSPGAGGTINCVTR